MGVILALQGASNRTIQALLSDFVDRWSRRGVRIAGVVEVHRGPELGTDGTDHLRDVATGAVYPLYQDLGSGSVSCKLAGAGLVDACERLQHQIAAGCDLVVLGKFGKLEAARSGLAAAFAAAIDTETPILTAVAPRFAAEWQDFAGSLAIVGVPEPAVIDRWWVETRLRDPSIPRP